jgi:hypothetical protein
VRRLGLLLSGIVLAIFGAVVIVGAGAHGSAYAADIEALHRRGVETTGTVSRVVGVSRTGFALYVEVGVSAGAGFTVEIDTSSLSHDVRVGEELAIVYDPSDLSNAELATALGRNAWDEYLPAVLLGGVSLVAGIVVLLVSFLPRSSQPNSV